MLANKDILVTVLMPAYNSAKYIAESIESVINQSYKNFELLIINDGSTDETQKIIDKYKSADSRIRSYYHKNKGLVPTLNKGVALSMGRYIARIDSDDTWTSDKLTLQIKQLQSDNSIVLIGTNYNIVDAEGVYKKTVIQPVDDDDIRRSFYLRNPFAHSSVIFNKSVALRVGLYKSKFMPAEDYELWIRMSRVGKLKNLNHVCMNYRELSSGISQTNSYKQSKATELIANNYWLENKPSLYPISEIKTAYNNHKKTDPLLATQILKDYAQIGVKMVKNKEYLKGVTQLIHVILSCMEGTQAVFSRLIKLRLGSFFR